jgi:anti-sigma factor ChrR (cupin superfamily)
MTRGSPTAKARALILFEVTDMSSVITPELAQRPAFGPLSSRLVDVEALPWQATRFPGVEIKPLLFDRKSGLASSLMRMAPGAELPDHEHVLVEQTWVLEGHLVDKTGIDTGIECKAGQFIWRPAGSRHSVHSPQGALMLAFFQIPNRFFEDDGRTTDMAGSDWESIWGALLGA